MKKRIYGYGDDYRAVIDKYLKNEILTVIGGYNEDAILAFKDADIDYTVCVGGFEAEDQSETARGIFGEYMIKGHIPCPNNQMVRERTYRRIRAIAGNSSVKGIIVDGCRFSSPANRDFLTGFVTCFCDVCTNKMNYMGFDSYKIKNAVTNFYYLLHDGKIFDIDAEVNYIRDWFSFRRVCTTEHFFNMRKALMETNESMLFGAYVFSPYIAGLVGQSYSDLSEVLDYISPMIYRHYRHPHGIACLDHELRAVLSYYDNKTSAQNYAISELLVKCFETDFTGYGDKQTLLDSGLTPEHTGEEVKKAKHFTQGKIKLYPIILIEDILFDKTFACVEQAGADEIDLFHYIREEFDRKFAI